MIWCGPNWCKHASLDTALYCLVTAAMHVFIADEQSLRQHLQVSQTGTHILAHDVAAVAVNCPLLYTCDCLVPVALGKLRNMRNTFM